MRTARFRNTMRDRRKAGSRDLGHEDRLLGTAESMAVDHGCRWALVMFSAVMVPVIVRLCIKTHDGGVWLTAVELFIVPIN